MTRAFAMVVVLFYACSMLECVRQRLTLLSEFTLGSGASCAGAGFGEGKTSPAQHQRALGGVAVGEAVTQPNHHNALLAQ
jgi:hypothetical protein